MPNNQSPLDKQAFSNDPATQKMGKNMMVVAWIIALVLLTYIFGNWEKKQINPNTSPKSQRLGAMTEVTLERNKYGHYVTNGSINRREVTFLVDTGATNVAIPGELQQQLGLRSGSSYFAQTANGNTKAYDTVIDSLNIGDIQLNDVKASIIPNMQGEEVLLGMSVLKQLEFTQKDNELILRQHH